MLTAYLDESGHEGKIVVVAGFLGDDSQWEQCVEKWREGLGPQRRRLHMKQLRWSKHGIRKMLEKLGGIPHKCGLRAVIGVAPVDYYGDLVTGTMAEKLTKGYYLAVIGIIEAILKNTPKAETIKLVFEQQEEYEASTRIICSASQELTPSRERRLSGIEFIPKDSSVLTQPADYLAFALLQGFRDQKSKKYKWCEPILRNTKSAFGMVPERDNLRKVIKSTIKKHPELMGDMAHFLATSVSP
ncbi:MAG: DUF3800 domain-containing protein [Candidatus Sulfotelmatobacter sp.]